MAFQLPVDSTAMTFVSMGKIQPKIAWVELSDGSRKPDPNGRQDTDKNSGLPLWVVDVVIDDDEEEGRADTIGVTVACAEKPDVGKFKPITFEGLTATPYLPKGAKRPTWSFRASGVAGGAASAKSGASKSTGSDSVAAA